MQLNVLRRRAAPVLSLFLFTALAACQGGISSAGTEISTSQAVMDLGQNLVDIREDNAMLQAQIDSLRGAVAYQDSVIRQLAIMSGVTMRPQSAPIP